MWGDTLPKNRFLRFWVLLAHRYLKHNVATQSAALAFYLLFMIFPFLIFISALLGLLNLNVAGIVSVLADFLPEVVLELTELYLTYVRENPSPQLMVFGLVFSVYFPMRATNTLMRSVRIAYHLGPPRGALPQLVKTLLYTAVLIATIALTLTLMSVGDRLLLYAVDSFGLPRFWAVLWAKLRFPVAAVAGYFALFSPCSLLHVHADTGIDADHAGHSRCRCALGCCIQVGINICRGIVIAVSQPLLNIFHWHTVFQQQRGACMPQVMKTNVSQFMLLQDELKMLGYIVGFIRNTQVIDKNIIALCVAVTTQLPTVLLSLLHTEQQFTVLRNQRH